MRTINECPTFDADALTCALALAGNTPTPDELTAALATMYPAGDAPTVAGLLAAGRLVPAISGRSRLRVPPLTNAELSRRLAELPPPEPTETAAPGGPLIGYFRGPITNTTPHAAVTPAQVHRVLTKPPTDLRVRADAARAEYAAHGKSAHYRELKNGLDYFTAGGTFAPTRADANLTTAAGLLTLDFDELAGQVAEARAALLADEALAPALVLLFVSPSGDGLKAVLAADPRHDRATNYRRLGQHLTRRYGWGPTLDKKTADVSRACFLSHDPTAWLAPAYAPAA